MSDPNRRVMLLLSWVCPCGAELSAETLNVDVACECGERWRIGGSICLARAATATTPFAPSFPHLMPGVFTSEVLPEEEL